jgi:hypothetical protein
MSTTFLSDQILFQGSGWLVVQIGETGHPTPWANGTNWDFVDPGWPRARNATRPLEPIFIFQAPDGSRYMQWCGQPFLHDKEHGRHGSELFAGAPEAFLGFLRKFLESAELCGCTDLALELLPPWLRSEELCRRALLEDWEAGASVPWERMSKTFIREAVERDWMVLRHVPDGLADRDICTSAVLQHAKAMSALPFERIPREAIERVLRARPSAIEFVPRGYRDTYLIALAEEAMGGLPPFDPLGEEQF